MSRFLDVTKVIEALERPPADDDARALVEAIEAEGKLKQQVLASKGKEIVSNDLQQRLIIASTKAAAARIAADPTLGPRVRKAIEAVVASGGTELEGLSLVQQSVLDEGFAWPDDPDDFDTAFLSETLDSLVALAKVDTDAVEAWVDEFVKQVDSNERPLRVAVAEALLESSWSDGPQPIAAEHVDDAIDALSRSVASNELEKAGAALVAFLGFLASKQLLGPARLARLTDIAKAAASAPERAEEEEDEGWGDEDDEEE
ncbi:MAG: hypothetical protein GQE15_41995 [Archangiaceae bacterium]|nr:hypothetical protein [Archangiaceae bacterium]